MTTRSGRPERRANQHAPRKRRTKEQIEKARKKAESSRRYYLKKRHQMSEPQYDEILMLQDNVCPVCLRAKGLTRKLAVDHDHRKAQNECEHSHDTSCENCWRGLLCSIDNDMFGHARDDPFFFARAYDYIKNPPAIRWRMGHRTKEQVNERRDGKKQCKRCMQWLQEAEFKSGGASDGFSVDCGRCITLTKYQLNRNSYEFLYEACEGKCWACGQWQEVLFVDHDHNCCPVQENRTIRTCGKCNTGLLCGRCNTAAGLIDENIEKAQGLLVYLKTKIYRRIDGGI